VNRGIFNIVLGVGLVVAGLSGKFRMIGTNSGTGLVIAGALTIAFGIFRLVQANNKIELLTGY